MAQLKYNESIIRDNDPNGDGWLTDDEIDFFGNLLREQCGYEFRDTWKFSLKTFLDPISKDKKHIHVLHTSAQETSEADAWKMIGGHWVCTFYDLQHLHVYDSLNPEVLHPQLLEKFKLLYPFYDFVNKTVIIHKVQEQNNAKDCGPFAIANSVTLAFGGDPENTVQYPYDTKRMRQHLLHIFETRRITQFPRISANGGDNNDANKKQLHTFSDINKSAECSLSDSSQPLKLRLEKNQNLKNRLETLDISKSVECSLSNSSQPLQIRLKSKRKFENESAILDIVETSEISLSNSSQPLQKRLKSKKKFKEQSVTLDIADKNIISLGKQLNDNHMHLFGKIMANCSFYNQQSTLYLQSLHKIVPIVKYRKNIQILFSARRNHWICTFYNTINIFIYDSLGYNTLDNDQLIYLQKLYPFYDWENRSFLVYLAVQQQPNSDDCGPYSIAFATSILFGLKPELITYDHSSMRTHLLKIYETNTITHFPFLSDSNKKVNLQSLKQIKRREAKNYDDRKRRSTTVLDIKKNVKKIKKKDKTEINSSGSFSTTDDRQSQNIEIDDSLQDIITSSHSDFDSRKENINKYEDKFKRFDKRKLLNSRFTKLISQKKKKTFATIKIANKIKSKYRRMNERDNDMKFRLNSEVCIRNISNKLEGEIYLEKRLEAEKIFKWSIYQRKRYVNKLYNSVRILKGKSEYFYSRIQGKTKTKIREKWANICGLSRHTMSTEPYFSDTAYNFANLSKIVVALNVNGQTTNILPLLRESGNKVWNCSVYCKIMSNDDKISTEKENKLLYDNYKHLLKILCSIKLKTFPRFLKQFFIPHSIDKLGHFQGCYSSLGDSCQSLFLACEILSPHFPSVRYIKRLIYTIKQTYRDISKIDNAVSTANLKYLYHILDIVRKQGRILDYEMQEICLDEDLIKEIHKTAFLALLRHSLDTPQFVCISCKKLCYKREVRDYSKMFDLALNSIWQDLHNRIEENEDIDSDYVCKYCLDFFRRNSLPPSCILNDLEVGQALNEISNFNIYELMLIQRIHAFQIIQRKGTVANKNLPFSNRLTKMIGQTFHLPLPIEQTMKKICTETDAINTNQDAFILVRGKPTKKKIIWENLVNIKKIYDALQKLKDINPLYSKINLPERPEQLLNSLGNYDVELHVNHEVDNNSEKESNDIELKESLVEKINIMNDKELDSKSNKDNSSNSENVNGTSIQQSAFLTQVVDSKSAYYEQFTINPMYSKRINKTSSELYQMKSIQTEAVYKSLKSLDLQCFPDLYPYGVNGQCHDRSVRLVEASYIKVRLLSADPRFRMNRNYIFFLLSDANTRQINSGIYHALNVVNNQQFTAKSYLNQLENGNIEPYLDTIFGKLRNSEQYWSFSRNDLECMVREYGPATWFLTLSPSEWEWDDLAQYLREINAPKFDKMSPSEMIATDPISVCRFMENKFQAMLKFLMSSSNPIGVILHYFWRREYQSRGIQHWHLVIWVEDAPIIGENTKDEISQFIMKYITCRLPNYTISPTLYRRVNTHQRHKHTNYCLRDKPTKINVKKGSKTKVCKFGFPRTITEKLILRDPVVSIVGRRKLQSRSRLYDLPRGKREEFINDYNPVILSAWEGNMDLQYIGEKSGLLTRYCTKYATKHETAGSSDVINDISTSTKSIRSKLWSIANRALSHREVGILEACDTLLGISLHGTDSDTTIRWLDVKINRRRRIKNREDIEKLNDDSTELYYRSLVDDDYPTRPKELENLSLYDFARWYDKIVVKPKRKNVVFYEVGKSSFLRKRSVGHLINHTRYNSTTHPENYYYALLLLFQPWRNTIELLNGCQTYLESFDTQKNYLLTAYQYHERSLDIEKALDDINKQINQENDKIVSGDNEFEGDDDIFLKLDMPDEEGNFQDLIDVNNMNVNNDNQETLDDLYSQLNIDQVRIFRKIEAALTSKDGKILRLFVSGEGGTGKSCLINFIVRWNQEILNEEVIVTAPTGLAALNINGVTAHRAFQLPVDHGFSHKYKQLFDHNLKKLREIHNNKRLVILDEFSMVSNIMAGSINLRMTEISDTVDDEDGWFGGKHIVVFGDLLQLPPVHGKPAFMSLSPADTRKYFGGMASVNLFDELFEYDELTINMRQNGDKVYASLVSRLRVGSLTNEDIELLETRKIQFTDDKSLSHPDFTSRINQLCTYINNLPPESVCIFATNEQCRILNEAVLAKIKSEEIVLIAIDSFHGSKSLQQQTEKLIEKYEDDASRTAGLMKEIKIKIGARIMIRRNIDLTRRLVNGSIGVIQSINKSKDSTGDIDTLSVTFNDNYTVNIERCSVKIQFMEEACIMRSQFPISLSYAMTIHKCQGMSVSNAVVDVGNKIFSTGQTYVALSRVTELTGLHLINFDPHNVVADDRAINEYNRLRKEFRPDLPTIQIQKKRWPKVFDYIWAVPEYDITNTILLNDNDKIIKKSIGIRGFSNDDEFSSCVNSVMQCMLHCSVVTDSLHKLKSSTDTPVIRLYNDYLNIDQEIISTLTVREMIRNQFCFSINQDVSKFIRALCEKELYLDKLFQTEIEITDLCGDCKYLFSAMKKEVVLELPLIKIEEAQTLQQLLDGTYNHWNNANTLCQSCQGNNTRQKIKLNCSSDVLAIKLNDQSVNQKKGFIKSVPTSNVLLNGKTYKVSSAILHHEEIKNHFLSFVKGERADWFSINNSDVVKKRWPTNSKKVSVFILEIVNIK